MDVSPYVAQLRDDLATAASAGDEQTRRTAALLSAAIEPAARLAILNALSDVAAEVTEALGDRTVELRLDGRDVRVSVGGTSTRHGDGPDAADAGGDRATGGSRETGGAGGFAGFGGPGGFGGHSGPDTGDISRVTLRIVEQIKAQAEQAAQSQGVSLNTWVAQAVQGALSGAERRSRPDSSGAPGSPGTDRPDDGRRLRGWVQG